ncbi:semaphorin-5A-like [Mytilus californianus]|uniref:semaphorin-5A-like n=1 Tax=Mytilus californianus TaxID=6549 RepID=UPI002246A9F8|nr:semaphorin-5A-like [Mytilus californianus]
MAHGMTVQLPVVVLLITINGGWSEWSKFSACPVTCGGSTNTRTRACDNPTPAYGGTDCVGDSSESAVCNTVDCPDYCESKPCENGASCANIHYGYKCTCVEGFQGNNCEIDIDDCVSVDCLHGGKCKDEVNAYSCVCVPGYAGVHCEQVHGSWSSYDPWNNCPVTCGGTNNNQYRSRYCNKPQPSCGGSSCSGTSKQYQICNSSPCPVDGQWSEWSSYGSCPVTCGSGAHSRYRTCNNPTPANGGASCKGLDTEYAICWSGECPG